VSTNPKKPPSDLPFHFTLFTVVGAYLTLIILLVLANSTYITWSALTETIQSPEILSSLRLTLLTCTISAILSLFVAIPIGYSLSRFRFPGRTFIDTLFDIPIILPPLVVGLALLVLFNSFPSQNTSIENWLNSHGVFITFHIPAIILAQFTIAAAFAIRSLKNTFDQINPRAEKVALTLGCNHFQAFWKITLPQANKGILAAGLLAWARALGEFGPILIFAGATRGKTEVLSTSVFLEINIGNLSAAAAVSLILITLAIITILIIRTLGDRK